LEILHSYPSDIQAKIERFMNAEITSGEDIKEVIDSLTPREREMVISYYKEETQNPDNSPFSGEYRALLDLGDDETIAMEAKHFPETGKASNLMRTDNPKVVPAFIPYLFGNDPDITGGSPDNPQAAPPFQAAYDLLGILSRSPYFSQDVHQWAKKWGDADDYKLRNMLRTWWIANKPHFDAGDYMAVQPGDYPPGQAPSSTPMRTPIEFPSISESTPTPQPSASPIPLPPKESTWPILTIVGILAVAVAGAIALLMRKK
jgi:hypothetical protein